jgi:hypothetical protein
LEKTNDSYVVLKICRRSQLMPTSTAVGREEAEACVSLLSAIERGKYLIRRPHETYNIEEFGPQCMSQRANIPVSNGSTEANPYAGLTTNKRFFELTD